MTGKNRNTGGESIGMKKRKNNGIYNAPNVIPFCAMGYCVPVAGYQAYNGHLLVAGMVLFVGLSIASAFRD